MNVEFCSSDHFYSPQQQLKHWTLCDIKLWIMPWKVKVAAQSSWPLKIEDHVYEVLCMAAYHNASCSLPQSERSFWVDEKARHLAQ